MKHIERILLMVGLGLILSAGGYWIHVQDASAATFTSSVPVLPSLVEGVTTAVPSSEWLVTTSSTCLTAMTGRRSVELFNNGPNTIWCSVTVAPTINKARPIANGTSWALDLPEVLPLCCLAATANQVTTAATWVTQTK
jgi:hypothetical protein